ncbi:YisB protein [Xylariomycetidae sp. FL2044]|nr:YisB protein [Xylariomycetidae sp. FL2044]
MTTTIAPEEQKNYDIFRECLSSALIERITRSEAKSRRRPRADKKKPKAGSLGPKTAAAIIRIESKKDEEGETASRDSTTITTLDDDNNTTADDLLDFTEYIASEIFTSLPPDLRTLEYHAFASSPAQQALYTPPLHSSAVAPLLLPTLDPAIPDSLRAYGILDPALAQELPELLAPVLTSYLATPGLTAAPPAPGSTRPQAQESGCEMCGRDWVPLSYHHLIPRFVHDKAVKRGWHRAEDLQSVAWLCGACHAFVHRFRGHEELARFYYTVDLLMAEEEVRRWAAWVGRLRWKGR